MRGQKGKNTESVEGLFLSRRQVAAGLVAGQFVASPLFAMGNSFSHRDSHKLGHAFHTHKTLHTPALIGRAKPELPLIMLDPGHGGKDPGAIGFSGTYEKHVAKAAALELRRQLLATKRFRVGMTRTSDYFIPLEGRVEIAQRHRASLFMSIHADSLSNASVRGASVYTHSLKASDRQTEALARSENSADRVGAPLIRGASQEVRQILAGLVTEESHRGLYTWRVLLCLLFVLMCSCFTILIVMLDLSFLNQRLFPLFWWKWVLCQIDLTKQHYAKPNIEHWLPKHYAMLWNIISIL